MTKLQSLSLDGDWSLVDGLGKHACAAAVPGTVHEALMASSQIPDPFWRLEESRVQWVDKLDWVFSKELPGTDLALHDEVDLVCDGIDTFADVSFNGTLIGRCDNMFRSWRFPVKRLLGDRANSIRIYFESPIARGLKHWNNLPYQLPAINDQSERGELGDRRVSVFARKAGYHYGWDWGPRLVTSGIWRSIRLEGWSGARISDIAVRTPDAHKEHASVLVTLQLEVARTGWYEIGLSLFPDEGSGGVGLGKRRHYFEAGMRIVTTRFDIDNPKLWWSVGLGDASLYTLKTELLAVREGETHFLMEKSTRFGVRTIELRREPDEFGTSFTFVLNGRPVFMHGANWIPNDNFAPRVNRDRLAYFVNSARSAGINMLRVWGGGYYEDESFYDLCDESGILVWQDFMFACSMYPIDEEFMENVVKEAQENIARLRNHACLALWCGNNEIDSAWQEFNESGGWNWKNTFAAEHRSLIWQGYDRIFNHVLPGLVAQLDPDHAYWPSSPQADWGEHARYDSTKGDVHYWGVWHGGESFERYNEVCPRFMSEFGFQSFPEPVSVRKFAQIPEDGDLESEVMAAHQRSAVGNGAIKRYMEKYLAVPDNFDDFLVASQILQAEAIRNAIEAHRLSKPRCMGSLYWQINDCWPAASWSSIDWTGRWKALHFEVKRCCAPLLLSLRRRGDTVQLEASNDGPQPVRLSWGVEIQDIRGQTSGNLGGTAEVPWERSIVIASWPLAEFSAKVDPTETVFRITAKDETGTVLADRIQWLGETRHMKFRNAPVEFRLLETAGDDHTLEVLSSTTQAWVWLHLSPDDADAGHFVPEDNFFHLRGGSPKLVKCRFPGSPDRLLLKLKARNVHDVCGISR